MQYDRTDSETLEQFADSDAERVGDDLQCLNRHVRLSALDLADVRPVQARSVGKNILRPPLGETKPPDGCPDLLLDILHQQQFRGTLDLSIQVITCNDSGELDCVVGVVLLPRERRL